MNEHWVKNIPGVDNSTHPCKPAYRLKITSVSNNCPCFDALKWVVSYPIFSSSRNLSVIKQRHIGWHVFC